MKICVSVFLGKSTSKKKIFVCVNPRGGSQFWRGLHEAKDTCPKGIKYVLGDGKKIRF
jgi:hypothetical protein